MRPELRDYHTARDWISNQFYTHILVFGRPSGLRRTSAKGVRLLE